MIAFGLAISALGFGLRHGVDWDHLAAISDIAGSQTRPRRSFLLATMYALGHALVVVVLGGLAIAFSTTLPDAVDATMERLVGITLLVLGVYVLYGLVRHGRAFRLRSRWMVVFALVRRVVRGRGLSEVELVEIEHDHPVDDAHAHAHALHHERVEVRAGAGDPTGHTHRHRHVVAMPDDPFLDYGVASAFGVGMIHGVGAETPSQVLVFAAAAGAHGTGSGFAVLACFVIGLLVSNSLIAVAATFGFLGASRSYPIYVAISLATAVFSLGIGVTLVLGQGTVLPAIFAG